MRKIKALGIAIIVVAMLAWDAQLSREQEKSAALIQCSNTGPEAGTDAQCDSCYHAIYGETDKGCGLCE